MVSPIVFLLAIALDRVLGDLGSMYRSVPHPVDLVVRYFQWGATGFNHKGLADRQRYLFGAGVFVVFAASIVFGVILVEHLADYYLPGFLYVALIAFIASSMFGMSSLMDLLQKVELAITVGELSDAREQMSALIGDEARELTKEEIVKRVIEEATHLFLRGVVAPIFWFALLGLPGLCFFIVVMVVTLGVDRADDAVDDFYHLPELFGRLMLLPARHLMAFLIACAALLDKPKWALAAMKMWLASSAVSDVSGHASAHIRAMSGALDLHMTSGDSSDRRKEAVIGDMKNATRLLERVWTALLCLALAAVFLNTFFLEGVFV